MNRPIGTCLSSIRALFPLAVAVLLIPAIHAGNQEPPDPLAAKAASFCRLFIDGEFERLQALMSADMQAAMTPEVTEQIHTEMLAQGAVKELGSPWLEEVSGEHRRYRIPLHLEDVSVDLRVVFDNEDKVAGFFRTNHVEPSESRVARKQEAAPAFLGHWEGSIELPGSELTVLVDLNYEEGYWSGAADIPMQAAKGLVLTGFRVEGKSVEFALADIPGNPTFHGTLEGTEINGTFTQGGQSFPFSLGREMVAEPARPQEPKPPFPYAEEEVSFENGSVTLAGTLTLPTSAGPFPAVLLISGSGAQDRNEEIFNHKPFLVLADHLTRAGIAVLRVDDRGTGKSSGAFAQATSEDFAEDALAGVRFLKKRAKIDAGKIGLIGHSEGGLIAPMVASRSADVAYIVMLAGPGVPGDEVLVRQMGLLARAGGAVEETIDRIQAAQRKTLDMIESGAEVDQVRAQVRELVISQMGEDSDGLDDAVAAAMLQLNTEWFRFFLEYDPRPALRRVRVPVLALNGTLDLQVDSSQNLPEIEKALKQANNADVTIQPLSGLNHLFQKAETGAVQEYYTLEETMNPAALDTIRDWILVRFGGGRREDPESP